MSLSSAQADIEIQALQKSLNLLSKLDISMTADRITLSAKEEVVINGGGSYTIWNASGITSGTTGTHSVQAASFSYPPGQSMPLVMPGLPQVPCARLPRGQMQIERRYSDDEGASQAPYRVKLADGSVREGRLDDAGRALLQEVPQGVHEVSIGEDAREWRSTQGDDPLANPAYGSRPDASQSLELYRAVLGSAAEEVAS